MSPDRSHGPLPPDETKEPNDSKSPEPAQPDDPMSGRLGPEDFDIPFESSRPRPEGEAAEPDPKLTQPRQPAEPEPDRTRPQRPISEPKPAGESTRPQATQARPRPSQTQRREPEPYQPSPQPEPSLPPPQRSGYVPPQRRPAPASPKPTTDPHPPTPRGRRNVRGCLVRWAMIGLLSVVVVIFVGLAAVAVSYVYIAKDLPSADELWNRQTRFVSSQIYDREGNLLWELLDPQGGRRTRVTLDRVSEHLINATVATEDEAFWDHRGFNPIAIARAFYQAFQAREIVSGFSTITQQVARNLLLSPEERAEKTAERKIKEMVLAYEIERRYAKETILEIYLNENNYGNLAYGIEAAAQTYFQKSAAKLNLSEASLLAGLPQSPATYDPFVNPEGALARQKDVLRLMVESGYITWEEANGAANEMRARIENLIPPRSDIPAPHFVQYVRQQVEEEFGPDLLYRDAGLRIYTTLDPRLQNIAEEQVQTGVAKLQDHDATNGALVAIDPQTGEILAMVGSVDFNDEEIDGQVNVALRCRQPGSSIKPLTYLAAFERGWNPATIIWDVKTEFPDGANPAYVPRNYDGEFHGNTPLRSALANSYNIPAVKTLQFVTVDGLLSMAQRLGVVSLVHPEEHCPEYPYDSPPLYGLSLTLGGGETKLLEMTGAYAVFANQGIRIEPSAIRYIESAEGTLVADYRDRPGGRVVSAQHAYLLNHILSDYEARWTEFDRDNVLELEGRRAAAKTGTTNDYRDAWTIGYTPQLVAGVWVGNSDNSEMTDLPGSRGAGPIWNAFMTQALADKPPADFARPPGIVELEICADSGTRPGPHCPNKRLELFVESQPPPGPEADLWQMVAIDQFSGLRANEYCPDHVVEKLFFVVPPEARQWAMAHGYEQPPEQACSGDTARPQVTILEPASGSNVEQGLIPVWGTVQMPNFDRYEVTFGVGDSPEGWGWISGPHLAPVSDGQLTVWDTTHLQPGRYTLRVLAFNTTGQTMEGRVVVTVGQGPPPDATATPLPPVPVVTPPPGSLPTPKPTAVPATPPPTP